MIPSWLKHERNQHERNRHKPKPKKFQISIWVQMFGNQRTQIERNRPEYLNTQTYSLIIF